MELVDDLKFYTDAVWNQVSFLVYNVQQFL